MATKKTTTKKKTEAEVEPAGEISTASSTSKNVTKQVLIDKHLFPEYCKANPNATEEEKATVKSRLMEQVRDGMYLVNGDQIQFIA